MIDILSAFLGPKLVLQAAGRWPEKNPTISIKLREFSSNLIEILLCLFTIAEIMYLLDDYENLYDHMSLVFTLSGHLVKILFFRIYSKNWLDIFDQCKSKHFNDYPAEFDDILLKTINFTIIFGNSFITACAVAAVMFAVVPILTDVDLPIRCTIISQDYRVIMFIFQSISLIVCAFTNSAIEAVTMNAISIAVGQLSILVEKIKSFNMEDQKIDIFECIKHHNEIIRYVGNVETAISKIVLVEYLKSILVLCFLGFQFIHVDPISVNFARIVIYAYCMVAQLAIYCFFANEILIKSTAVGEACYESSWYDFDEKIKKCLILIMERSKRPLCITAGNFSVVSLSSFTSVMKTSYTYFALMETLYKDSRKS